MTQTVREASLMFAAENATGTDAPGWNFESAFKDADALVKAAVEFRAACAKFAADINLSYNPAPDAFDTITDIALCAVDAFDHHLTKEATAVVYAAIREV